MPIDNRIFLILSMFKLRLCTIKKPGRKVNIKNTITGRKNGTLKSTKKFINTMSKITNEYFFDITLSSMINH